MFARWMLQQGGKKALKEGSKTIRSIAPNVPKTNIEKAQRTLNVEGHKIKAKISKISSDIFHKTQELKKKVDKIKIKKPK